ncbi:AGC (cAMP-dependent, cGMP-dependent and protein kinase C) kinase family protein [Artemisia annua]|uniref:AGC (cAMP-dependent, cGMP-dependent and protein kinase C) kinase family protein n=1 Tax=Artemisia annua TaxID=35608 RepID=A0A2U1KEQ1_ARTAN|nr:AGC (cAMP-dependent, cGMP-dependent and protein kinase C) kinase family protein [Artemisia annua]
MVCIRLAATVVLVSAVCPLDVSDGLALSTPILAGHHGASGSGNADFSRRCVDNAWAHDITQSLLEEKVYLGTILGALLIVGGLYCVLWGKSREMLSSKDVNFMGYTYKNFEIVNEHEVPRIAELKKKSTKPKRPTVKSLFSKITLFIPHLIILLMRSTQ